MSVEIREALKPVDIAKGETITGDPVAAERLDY